MHRGDKENVFVETKDIQNINTVNKEIEESKKNTNNNIITKDKETTTRVIPHIVLDLVKKGFNIVISKNGYLIPGFYGLNKNGFAELLEIEKSGVKTIVIYDNKKKEHVINNFEDIVRFQHNIWKSFYRIKEHRKIDHQWFKYLMDLDLLEFTPK